jgi:molybdopterin-guanine dinucleotide biosynthesis protein A
MGGRPKALLELGGRRIIERVLDAVAPVVDDVLIVTNTPELYGFLGLPMVADAWPEHGSLGGIFTGLAAASGEAAFTVACDMPFLHREVARLVVARAGEGDVVIPRVGAQLQTLHAVYAKACLPHIEARLRAGQLRITGFFQDVRVVEIAEADVARHRAPDVAFMNVNTPEELERARALVAELG